MQVIVEPDFANLSLRAATLVANTVRANPRAVLALPTGRTPQGMYRELVRMHERENLDFSQTRIFNLDEYLGLPSTDHRSFDYYLKTNFLSRVDVRPENIHLLPCIDYERKIAAAGSIDLLIAGVGTNGHIAFNEPGSELDSRTRIVELAETTLEGMRAVFSDHDMPKRAVTMGIGTILESRKILVLASGSAKRRAVRELLEGPVTTRNPVSAIRLHGDVTLITDQEVSGSWNRS